jgi:hypothetical protein
MRYRAAKIARGKKRNEKILRLRQNTPHSSQTKAYMLLQFEARRHVQRDITADLYHNARAPAKMDATSIPQNDPPRFPSQNALKYRLGEVKIPEHLQNRFGMAGTRWNKTSFFSPSWTGTTKSKGKQRKMAVTINDWEKHAELSHQPRIKSKKSV